MFFSCLAIIAGTDKGEKYTMKAGKNVVLVAEDDPKLYSSLREFLTKQQYIVRGAQDGQTALDLFFSANQEIDLILLDVMLPVVDGMTVLKTIREYSDVPVIMATARESEEDQLEGLGNGADNYITKPFRLRVLAAHMEALLKRRGNMSRKIVFDNIDIDLEAQELKIDGKVVEVTPKEFALLVFFIQNKNKVMTRENILNCVWGFDYNGDMRTVDTIVKQLRKKMGNAHQYIHSVYGIGYCFKEG